MQMQPSVRACRVPTMDDESGRVIPAGCVIVFYDGLCGFCNKALLFAASRDRDDRLRFTPLQSEFARDLLFAHDIDPSSLDTMYTLVDYGLAGERVFSRAAAVLRVFSELGGAWRIVSVVTLLPEWVLNRAYNGFASRRYQVFGKHDQCPVPKPEVRRKFVDLPSDDAD